MPIFTISNSELLPVEQTNFDTEKELQRLIEDNLRTVFNCRFVATEFSTGENHAGRIDTLALSEDGNPVIIEYKKSESSDLINQGLFYLSWIRDHRGDFQIAVQKKLGSGVQVDWSGVRVICIAPNYRKYDLHAVQVMGANIELWQYRKYANGSLYLQEVFRRAYVAPGTLSTSLVSTNGKNPIMVEAGRKAALTRKAGSYNFKQHIAGKPKEVVALATSVQEYVLGLDPAIEEAPKKLYVAYKISQNIVCMEVRRSELVLFLKLDPKQVGPLPPNARDVSHLGHFGTGDLELRIGSANQLEAAKPLIERAYRRIGS
jgi:predicted transport protein